MSIKAAVCTLFVKNSIFVRLPVCQLLSKREALSRNNWCQKWDATVMEIRSQKKQEESMAALFAKLEEQAARQKQFYREQGGKLEQQAVLCRE